MVKPVWVAVAFVCGIVLGVVGARFMNHGEGRVRFAPDPELSTSARAAARVNVPAAAVDTDVQSDAAPGEPATVGDAGDESPSSRGDAVATGPQNASAADGVASRRIDVGDTFHQMVDRPSVPGFPNEFGDAHRTLEGEQRDDSWAPQLEAEIQNSLVSFTSIGALELRFLECRATICELRVFASEAHSDALNTWQEVMQSQPWIRRVEMVGGSLSMVKGGAEGLWIFRKAPTAKG